MPVSAPSRLALPKLPKRENTSVPRSQTERIWITGGAIVAFVMLLIGYFFFISPQRSHTSSVDAQVTQAKQQNAVLQARINALREQSKQLPHFQAELAQAQLALPSTSGVSDFLRTLQALGNATLTNVTSLTVAPPAAVTLIAPGAPVASATPGAPTPTATQSAAPAAAAATTTGATAGPATPTIYALPISATVSGSVSGLAKFLQQLQSVQPRAVLISAITEASADPTGTGQTNGAVSLQLTMKAFVAPSDPAVSASLSAAAH